MFLELFSVLVPPIRLWARREQYKIQHNFFGTEKSQHFPGKVVHTNYTHGKFWWAIWIHFDELKILFHWRFYEFFERFLYGIFLINLNFMRIFISALPYCAHKREQKLLRDFGFGGFKEEIEIMSSQMCIQ